MHVFVFGATGYIGSAVIEELKAHGHVVTALTRKEESAQALSKKGFEAIVGEMQNPKPWIKAAIGSDAIIQLADTFDSNAGKHETTQLNAIETEAKKRKRQLRFIYTGGCWLYGNTADDVALEGQDFAPFPEFNYSVKNRAKLLESKHFKTSIIHPAMVWDRNGGVLHDMLECARLGSPIKLVKSADTRWPMVHRDDLAVLYRLVLEKGASGKDYHGVAGDAVTVGDLARAAARRMAAVPKIEVISVEEIVAKHGEWARGYGIDHQMSGQRTMFELGWQPHYEDALAHLGPYGPLS